MQRLCVLRGFMLRMSLAIGLLCCIRILRRMRCINVQSARRHWIWRGEFSTVRWRCILTGGLISQRPDCPRISARRNSCRKMRMCCWILLWSCSIHRLRWMRRGGLRIGICRWGIRAVLCASGWAMCCCEKMPSFIRFRCWSRRLARQRNWMKNAHGLCWWARRVIWQHMHQRRGR